MRRHVSHLFGGRRANAVLADVSLCQSCIHSPAFALDSFGFVHAVAEQPDLIPCALLLFAVCDVFTADLSGVSRTAASAHGHTAGSLVPLIRRLYEQAAEAGESGIVQQCLDQIDFLAQARVGWRDVLTELES